ncbi:hypothetical protein HOP50_09g57220 [Chloropicon primus]|nr:hypothetical protein HOP50_09g57220 [Chloropicon primus]
MTVKAATTAAVGAARESLKALFTPRTQVEDEWTRRKYFDPYEDVGCSEGERLCLSLWDLVSFLCSCAVLLILYFAARRSLYKTPKQRCWVLTCLNSVVTPLLSFRSLFRIVNNQWEYGFVAGGSRSSRFCTLFFMAYLACELVVGSLDYRKQVSLVMGYVHHVSYLALSIHLVVENRTNLLAMTLVEELPTLILGVGRLGSFDRGFDFAFGLSFIVTRIIFHLYVQYNLFLWRKDDNLGWYWKVCTLSFLMNMYWLLAWWKSVKRRRLKYSFQVHRSRKSKRVKAWPTMSRIMTKSYQVGKQRGKKLGARMRNQILSYRQRFDGSQIHARLRTSARSLGRFAADRFERIEKANRDMLHKGQRMKRATAEFLRSQKAKLKRE